MKIIPCVVSAHPQVVRFKWIFNSTKEFKELPQSQHKFAGSKSELPYQPKTHDDYGLLTCLSKNEVGSQKSPCIFKIVEAAIPDPVWNCTLHNKTDSVVVSCAYGPTGGLPQTFHMELHTGKKLQNQYNISNPTKPWFEIKNLIPNRRFSAIIYSENTVGKSKGVELQGIAPSMAEMLASKEKSNSVSIPVISALIILLVFLIFGVVVFLIYKRTYREVPQDLDTVDNALARNESSDFIYTLKSVTENNLDTGQITSNTEIDQNPDVVPNKNGKFITKPNSCLKVLS